MVDFPFYQNLSKSPLTPLPLEQWQVVQVHVVVLRTVVHQVHLPTMETTKVRRLATHCSTNTTTTLVALHLRSNTMLLL
jgi:hypothetical protein